MKWGKWLGCSRDWGHWFDLINICSLNLWCIFGQPKRTCWVQFINRINEIQRARTGLFGFFSFIQSSLKWPDNSWKYDYSNILLSFPFSNNHLIVLSISIKRCQWLRIWCRFWFLSDTKYIFYKKPLSQLIMVHLELVYFAKVVKYSWSIQPLLAVRIQFWSITDLLSMCLLSNPVFCMIGFQVSECHPGDVRLSFHIIALICFVTAHFSSIYCLVIMECPGT